MSPDALFLEPFRWRCSCQGFFRLLCADRQSGSRLSILPASSRGLNGRAAMLCLFKDDLFYDFIVSVLPAVWVRVILKLLFLCVSAPHKLLCVSGISAMSSGVQEIFFFMNISTDHVSRFSGNARRVSVPITYQ